MSTVVIIPARLESTRLARKLLLSETGHPLLWYTWRNAQKASLPLYIATDSSEIVIAAESWGAAVIRTQDYHLNGTSRLVEAKDRLPDADLIINLQGDHPDVEGYDLLNLERFMRQHCYDVGTLATALPEDELFNPNTVKVAVSGEKALYFSRGALAGSHKHVGIYAYWRGSLDSYPSLPRSPLGEAERLEQIAWLEAGNTIGVAMIAHPVIGIDTREDYDRFILRTQDC